MIKIIGIGSPFGGDTVGWRAIDYLEKSPLQERFPDQVFTFLRLDRPGTQLLTEMSDAQTVILIDALLIEKPMAYPPVGKVLRLELDDVMQQQAICSSHAFDLASTLALGKVLGKLPERLLIYGVVMQNTQLKSHHKFEEDVVSKVLSIVQTNLSQKLLKT